ncbi:outer membrane protein TOM13-domain-containing protein [Lineolata rhizophorae]|uniref:Outer membrane protein TOM13-domain-containing protein n=1 Tax=Lineolata rhizophorae TaxID=578093 RepID=A0A6A6NVB3_9PEZI|nr:outer membrane protein TOM13-domain-containing protein [Lineolata rhizophorae]
MTDSTPPTNLSSSGVTIPSDSENYSANNELSSSPSHVAEPDSSSPPDSGSDPARPTPPVVLYSPPTIWGLVRGAAINLLLPFVNGLMLGFGELIAHEVAFRLGWEGTKVFPIRRREGTRQRARPAGPGIEVREDADARGREDC